MDDALAASVAKALAHPARLQILRLLAGQPECRGADVFSGVPLAQSTISEHLRVLKEAGVICSRMEGTAAVYCLAPDVLDDFIGAVSVMAPVRRPCREDSCSQTER